MKKTLILIFIIMLIFSSSLWAQDLSRVGTAAAQFLKLGVGARAAALGEAAVTMPNEVSGLYWNPATVATIDRTSLAISRNELYADLSYNFIGIVQPLGRAGTIGASIIYLDSGEMEITTLSDPEGTGSNFSWEAYCIGLSYSRFVTDRLSLGGTVKYIREGAYHQKAETIAIDIGSLLNTGIMGLKMGMCLSNFGGNMQLGGPNLLISHDRWATNPGTLPDDAYLKTESYPLPLIFRIGLAMEVVGHEGQIMKSESSQMTVMVDAYDPNDALLRSNFGVEYNWNNILALRAGFRGITVEEDEHNSYDTASYTFGGGIGYDLNFAFVKFDYAFTDFKLLGSGHLFTLVMAF
ncbi:MAG: PorV/PorQ family protein [bacterium]|nr:PorV/PorQ family protein [bacterium]